MEGTIVYTFRKLEISNNAQNMILFQNHLGRHFILLHIPRGSIIEVGMI